MPRISRVGGGDRLERAAKLILRDDTVRAAGARANLGVVAAHRMSHLNDRTQSRFDRHQTTLFVALSVVMLGAFLIAAEVMLRELTGLGEPVLFERHPAYGYRLLPDQQTKRFGGALFKVNNLGLRAANDWDENTSNKVLFLGDSVTYGGNHISNAELFSEVAIQALPSWQSGNAGMPNWGVENVYGLVVEEDFQPADVYVTTFIENDFYRGLTSGENKPWIKYEKPLLAVQELADFLWHRWVRNPSDKNRAELEQQGSRSVRAERAVSKLEAMDDLLRSRGRCHLILMSPTRAQTLAEEDKDSFIQAMLARQGLEVVYLLDVLRDKTPSEDVVRSWYKDDVHLSARGHQVWGELIRDELVKRGRSACALDFG